MITVRLLLLSVKPVELSSACVCRYLHTSLFCNTLWFNACNSVGINHNYNELKRWFNFTDRNYDQTKTTPKFYIKMHEQLCHSLLGKRDANGSNLVAFANFC